MEIATDWLVDLFPLNDLQTNPHGWPGGWKDGQSNGWTGRVHWAGRIKSMWCAQTAMCKFLRPHSKTKSTWHNPSTSTCSTQKHAHMSRPVLQQVTWTPVCITDMHIPKPISAALQSCSLFKRTSWLWLRVPMQKRDEAKLPVMGNVHFRNWIYTNNLAKKA